MITQENTQFKFCLNFGLGHLLLLLFITPVFSDPSSGSSFDSRPLDLETAIERALTENPGLVQSTQMYLSAQTKPKQVSALPDPVLTLGAMNLPTDTFERDQEPMTQMQVGISQSFPFPGKRGQKEESAELMVDIAKYSVQEKKIALTNMVTMAWWDVFYLDKAIETVEKNKTLLKQLIKVAEKKYETGQGLQQDVLLSHLELSKVLEKELQVKVMRKKKVSFLNSLLDERPENAIILPQNIHRDLPKVKSEDELYSFSEQDSPLLNKAETLIDKSESDLSLAKREYLPDFTFGITYGDREGNNPAPMGGERSDFASVMLGIKVPLYAHKKQSKQIEEKTIDVQSALYAHKQLKNQLFSEISSEYANYIQLKEQLALFEAGIIPQSKQTTESMLAGYRVSQVDFLNLIGSQMSLLNYELLFWKTFSDSHKSLSKLQTLVGRKDIYE